MIQPALALLGQETDASTDVPANEEEDVQEVMGEDQDAGAYRNIVPALKESGWRDQTMLDNIYCMSLCSHHSIIP